MLTLNAQPLNTAPFTLEFRPTMLAIAGWTGRKEDTVRRHIAELAELGVHPPEQIPTIYRIPTSLLTTNSEIEVTSRKSSGEAEFCLLDCGDEIYVTVGSDHTDRDLETADVKLSKQVCAKPISSICWLLSDIADHWDAIILRSFIRIDSMICRYQDETLAEILPPENLLTLINGQRARPQVSALFSGTVPIIGQIICSEFFRAELHDPILKRTLSCAYTIKQV